MVLYFSESGNICLGTNRDPNVKATEIANIYHKPKEYIGNSGATNKVADNNENHNIEKVLAGASQLFKWIRLNIAIDPNEINGMIIPIVGIYFIFEFVSVNIFL